VPVLPADPFANPRTLTFQQSFALGEAEARAKRSPAVYARPYMDSAGTVHVPVTTPAAQAEAVQPILVPPDSAAPDEGTGDPTMVPPPLDSKAKRTPSAATEPAADAPPKDPTQSRSVDPKTASEVIPRTRVVPHTWERLQQIADELTELTPADITDLDKTHSTAVHPESGRVIVETTEATTALRTALAARYGDAVALYVTPQPVMEDQGRDNASRAASQSPDVDGRRPDRREAPR
jgi:hypothetical protein